MTHLGATVQREEQPNLPILPTILVELLSVSLEDEHYFSKIESLAERDPALALKIIQLSNTAKNTTVKPITSIKEAIVRMGTKEVFNLMSLVALTQVFVPSSAFERRLWRQSLHVAELTKFSLKHTPEPLNTNPDTAYLVGLLHNIGLILRHQSFQKWVTKVDPLIWNLPFQPEHPKLNQVKQKSALFSAKACQQWGIPTPIPALIYFQHHAQFDVKEQKYSQLLPVLHRLQFAKFVSAFAISHQAIDENVLLANIEKHPALINWISHDEERLKIISQAKQYLTIANLKFNLLNI